MQPAAAKQTKCCYMKARRRRPRQSAIEARERILDAAEELFSVHGYTAVSIRSITEAAKVNVAAVHYYFETKEKLFEEVFNRRITVVNEERLRLLEEAIARAEGGLPALEDVVRAYIAPYLQYHEKSAGAGAAVMRFLSRAITDPNPATRKLILRQMDPIWYRFSPILQEIIPEVPKSTLYWRFYFLIGTLYYVVRGEDWLEDRTDNLCSLSNMEEVYAELSRFCIGGLLAPVERDAGSRSTEAELSPSGHERDAAPAGKQATTKH